MTTTVKINGQKIILSDDQRLYSVRYGEDASDLSFAEHTVYRIDVNQYIEIGSGGPRTIWGHYSGHNTWSGGHGHRVLTKEEAWEDLQAACSTTVASITIHDVEACRNLHASFVRRPGTWSMPTMPLVGWDEVNRVNVEDDQ